MHTYKIFKKALEKSAKIGSQALKDTFSRRQGDET